MTIIEALDAYTNVQLERKLFEMFPTIDVEAWSVFLGELRSLSPIESDLSALTVHMVEPILEDDKPYVGVNVKDKDGEEWAADFIDWRELIALPIEKTDDVEATELELVCHCMWEMTFHGFTWDRVKSQSDELEKRVEDAKSGKSKTIPLEDVKKNLGIED